MGNSAIEAEQSESDQTAPRRCFVEATLEVISGKWKPMILWNLIQGTKRFGELRKLIPGVTQQMLTMHLRELEQDGVVHRHVFAEIPPKVEYSATPLGRTLEPILGQMHHWGVQFVALQEAADILPKGAV